MHRITEWTAFCGRLLIGLGFLGSGMAQIIDWDRMIAHLGRSPLGDIVGSQMIPTVLFIAVIIQVTCGMLVTLGWKTRKACVLLALMMAFMILTMRQFWNAGNGQFLREYTEFVEDGMALGSVLLLLAFGPGRISVDRS